jgi:hypothetical protein
VLSALAPAAGALRQAKVLWVREGFAKVTRFGAFRDRGARGIQGELVSGVLELFRAGGAPPRTRWLRLRG